MNSAISIVAWILASLAGLPLAILCLELLAGLWPHRIGGSSKRAARIAVLIPAHDEVGGIAEIVRNLKSVAPSDTRILVVADNCTDMTASVAAAAGAEVIERHNKSARGKGFALAFGRDHLGSGAEVTPDVVIVLDADCRLSAGSIEALAEATLRRDTPAQAVNLISPDLSAPPMVQISSFAMVVKNLFRSRGMQRLGGAALLTGTGMAFPWPLFARAELATGSIVEDLALGIELTRQGHKPFLVETAHVRSAPADMRDALDQRKRWEHGFLDTLRRYALPVLVGSIRRGSLCETLLGLHLLVPPLALTMLIALAVLLILGAFTLAGASGIALIALASLFALSCILVLAAWLGGGRPFLSGSALLRAPLYILWKLPIYVGFLLKPQTIWTRTPRRDDN